MLHLVAAASCAAKAASYCGLSRYERSAAAQSTAFDDESAILPRYFLKNCACDVPRSPNVYVRLTSGRIDARPRRCGGSRSQSSQKPRSSGQRPPTSSHSRRVISHPRPGKKSERYSADASAAYFACPLSDHAETQSSVGSASSSGAAARKYEKKSGATSMSSSRMITPA